MTGDGVRKRLGTAGVEPATTRIRFRTLARAEARARRLALCQLSYVPCTKRSSSRTAPFCLGTCTRVGDDKVGNNGIRTDNDQDCLSGSDTFSKR